MTEKIKLLVVEDARDVTKLSKSILTSKGFTVETCAKDGREVVKAAKLNNPDVIILEMYMANLDAPAVIKAVMENAGNKKPAIIVATNYDNGMMEKEIMQAGASYFLLKPFDYDVLCERIISLAKDRGGKIECNEKKMPSEVELEIMVTDILHQIGVPAHVKGYQYVRTSIVLAILDREIINHITKELYPTVAKRYKSTATRVERAIRHAIELAWDRGDVDVLNSYFGYTIHNQKGKPTNSEFVAMIADKLCLKLKAC